MAQTISLDTQKLANQVEVTVNIKKYRSWRTRLWLAEKLFRLGAWIAWMRYSTDGVDPIEAMEELGQKGIVISIAYGPMRGKGIHYSVDCLDDKTRETFERPYQADSFEQCVEIAKIEASKRGWINENSMS